MLIRNFWWFCFLPLDFFCCCFFFCKKLHTHLAFSIMWTLSGLPYSSSLFVYAVCYAVCVYFLCDEKDCGFILFQFSYPNWLFHTFFLFFSSIHRVCAQNDEIIRFNIDMATPFSSCSWYFPPSLRKMDHLHNDPYKGRQRFHVHRLSNIFEDLSIRCKTQSSG